MELYAPTARVTALEAELALATGADRTERLIELAWHLRQRDSLRALSLADAADAALLNETRRHQAQAGHFRLALLRAEIAAMFCRSDEARTWLDRARELAGSEPDGEVDLLLAQALVAKARGERAQMCEAYELCVGVGARSADSLRAAIAPAWLAYENAFTVTIGANESSARLPQSPAVDALFSAAQAVRLVRSEPQRAVNLFLHASEQAQRVGLIRDAVVATLNAGTTLRGLGQHDKAAACFDICESVARQTGWPMLLGVSRTQLGAFLAEHGLLRQAHRLLVEAHVAMAPTPAGINRANTCSELAQVLLHLGRAVEALAPTAEAIRMYRDAGSLDNLALTLIHQALVMSAADQAHAALASIDEARTLIDAHDLSVLNTNVYQALAEVHARHALPPPPGMTEPTAALHFGERALREGERIEGWCALAADLTALADRWAAAGDMQRAYAHARQALRASADARSALTRSPPHLAPLQNAQAPPPLDASGLWRPAFPAPQSSTDKLLTASERRILQLLARNYSNKEIAISLEVGDQTVKWHLKNIFGKLDVGTRKQAVARARALGVVAVEAE